MMHPTHILNCLMLFFALGLTNCIVRAEEFRDVESLLRKYAFEREKFYQYSVAIDINGACPVADEVFIMQTDSRSVLNLDFEYSRIGSHYITKGGVKGDQVNVVIGETDGLSVSGDSTSNIVVKAADHWNAPDRRCTELLVFDPRATGILTAEEYAIGARFETAFAELREVSKRETHSTVFQNKDGHYELSLRDSGLRIVFDQKRNYWPIEFDHFSPDAKYSNRWRVQLGKFNDQYVPISAKLTRIVLGQHESQSEKHEVNFEYRWRSINRFIPTGRRAIENLKERWGVEIEQSGS